MRARAFAVVALLALTACGPSKPQERDSDKAAETPAAAAPQATASPSAGPAIDPVAAAFEARFTPGYNQCLTSGDAAKGVTSAMAGCIADELAVQDKALNLQYARVMHRLPPEQAVGVRDAQRQWIKERDAKCRAEASSGGTMDRITGPSCLLDETILRTMELERMAPPER